MLWADRHVVLLGARAGRLLGVNTIAKVPNTRARTVPVERVLSTYDDNYREVVNRTETASTHAYSCLAVRLFVYPVGQGRELHSAC